MTKSIVAALAAVVVLAFAAVPATLSAAEAGKVSPASAKALKAVQEANTAKQWGEAISLANKALAVPEKTPFDTLTAYRFMAYAHQQQGNKAELLRDLQGQLDSGALPPAEQNQIIKNMYGTAFELKDYAQAEGLGNRLIRSGAAGPETYDQVAVAMVAQGKQADALKFLTDYVLEQEKRGQKPSEATLTRVRDLQEKAGNMGAASLTVEKLVTLYPKDVYWNLLTHQLTRDPKLTDRQKLQIFRLKVATGTLKRCQDFSDMEEMADAAGMPGESQKVIEQALAAKVCNVKSDEDRLRRHLNSVNNVVAEDKARFAKLEADARASKTGELDVAVGSQLFGYGEYAKAAEALARAVAKGGLKNSADAQLTMAIAQLRAGNRAESAKTLRSIKADDAITQRVVKLWSMHVQ